MKTKPPLIVHVIHHLWVGGLENGLINLINHIPEERYRHVIICMDDYSDFKDRLQRDDVLVFSIHKKEGHDLAAQWRLFKLFRALKPDILHSRNLSGLDALLPAFFAGIKHRIHGEHGRDVNDLDGSNKKLQLLRRLHRPFINQYIPLSKDLERYLLEKIGVNSLLVTQIYNGVDTAKFSPPNTTIPPPTNRPFSNKNTIIIGTVGRFQAVKDQDTLADGFIELLNKNPELKQIARLVMIGDGPLRASILEKISAAGYADLVWAPGASDDVNSLIQSFDIFVLPSLAEGISNTLLEAMSCGLPVIATNVGGNSELVSDGTTGTLIPAHNSRILATTLYRYLKDKSLRISQGRAGRLRVEERFSLTAMVESYIAVYDKLLKRH